MHHDRSRSSRPLRRAVPAVIAVGLIVGCSSTTTSTTPSTTAAPGAGGSVPATTAAPSGTSTPVGTTPGTTARRPKPAPLADQTPPKGTNGIAYDGGGLWVADLTGGQLLGVDPVTGEIVARYGQAEGMPTGPDDVAVGPDGSVYWTGFGTGDVGRITFADTGAATIEVLANIGAGANPISFADDGTLYVGRAVTGDGLYEIDPTGREKPREIVASLGNVNAFDVAPNGRIYGPKFGGAGAGSVVRINPGDGSVEQVATGLNLPFAVKLSADGMTAYVAEAGPPAQVRKVDLTTGALSVLGPVPATIVDNLALGPDGTVYVTLFNKPEIAVLAPDGTTRTISIGKA